MCAMENNQRFDIDMGFSVHPLTKDLVVKKGKNAIKQIIIGQRRTAFFQVHHHVNKCFTNSNTHINSQTTHS